MNEPRLSKGLDFYKPTMSQLEYTHHPNAEVTFTLKNRSENLLSEYVNPEQLRERLDQHANGWQPDEIEYLAGLTNQDGGPRFGEAYLHFIQTHPLPPVDIDYDERGDLAIQTRGIWHMATFWETVVMSEINELYFENKLASEGIDIRDLYREGDRRLDQKIEILKQRPDIKFSDFGTRRRFSYDWHRHVVERLAEECPNNFVGTSNVYLAKELDLQPIGTFAHELPMGYAALADARGDNPLVGHKEMLRDWRWLYGDDLSTALTDTFTTGFFFADFSDKQAEQWKALRHDSGDPTAFGKTVIQFYRDRGIDPSNKTIVFSDGLDIDTIVELADTFQGRINTMFGWGTTLTNDLGIPANNFVMKATELNGQPTVKLSDTPGKHTGPAEYISRYQHEVESLERGIGSNAVNLANAAVAV